MARFSSSYMEARRRRQINASGIMTTTRQAADAGTPIACRGFASERGRRNQPIRPCAKQLRISSSHPTKLRVKPRPMPANVCEGTAPHVAVLCIGRRWLALAGEWSGRWESKIPL